VLTQDVMAGGARSGVRRTEQEPDQYT